MTIQLQLIPDGKPKAPFHPRLFENLTMDVENHTDSPETQLDLINRVGLELYTQALDRGVLTFGIIPQVLVHALAAQYRRERRSKLSYIPAMSGRSAEAGASARHTTSPAPILAA